MPDPVQTVDETPPSQPTITTLADLATHGTQDEYREVREGKKSVAEVVAKRREPTPAAPTDAVPPAEGGKPSEVQKTAVSKAGKTLAQRKEEIQNEINALVRLRGDTQRERDAIAAEVERLKGERQTLSEKPKEAQSERDDRADDPDDPEPVQQPDEAYEDWITRKTRWITRQEYRTLRAKEEERQRRTRQADTERRLLGAFEQRKTEFRKSHPDFDEVLAANRAMPITPEMRLVLIGSEQGPALAYYFASHPEEASRVASLPPVRQFVELGTLVARLDSASSSDAGSLPVSKSQAAAPITPVGTAPTTASRSLETAAAAATNADYRRLREEGVRR